MTVTSLFPSTLLPHVPSTLLMSGNIVVPFLLHASSNFLINSSVVLLMLLNCYSFFSCHVRTSKMLPCVPVFRHWPTGPCHYHSNQFPSTSFYPICHHIHVFKAQKRRFLFLQLIPLFQIFLLITPLPFWNLIPKKGDIQLLPNQIINSLFFFKTVNTSSAYYCNAIWCFWLRCI